MCVNIESRTEKKKSSKSLNITEETLASDENNDKEYV